MQRDKLTLLLVALQLGATWGCGDHEPGMPSRTHGARPATEAGVPDAGSLTDASIPDAATAADAGAEADAAPPDGLSDAATPSDAGIVDAATPSDAGIVDAATPSDAGIVDAATPDAGIVDAATPDASVTLTRWVGADTLVLATLHAGDSLSVTCLLEDEKQQRILAPSAQPSSVAVVPAGAAMLREDGAIVATRAGDLAVACSFPALGLVDSTPAVVKVLPGAAAKTVATLDRSSMVAGQSVAVGCSVFDAFDNPIVDLKPTLRSVPLDAKNKIESGLGTFEGAGSFDIHCELGGATSVPAKLAVLPALPASLVVARVPDRASYGLGEVVELTRAVADRFGNPVLTANVPVVSEPTGTSVGNGRFSYAKAGTYRLTATVTPPTEGGVVLSKAMDLLVDSTGPAVGCDYPLDGASLDLVPGGKLVFRGTASDPSGIQELRVNDTISAVDAAGHFTAELTSRFGLNFVDIVSVDGGARQAKRLCTFLVANRWLADRASLDDGLSFWLRQPAVDDGSRGDFDTMADVLNAVLASGSLRDAIHGALLANSVLKSGCDQTLLGRCILSSQVSYLDTKIAGPNSNSLTLVDNGLASTTRISNLAVQLRLDGNLAGLAYQNQGWVNFESIDVNTTFDMGISGGRPRATLRPGSTTTSVGRISTDFSGLEGEVLAVVVQIANGVLREYVAMRVQAYVTENLSGVLDGMVESLDASVFSAGLSVDRFDGTAAIPLQVDTQFSSLSTSPSRMLFGMGASFTAPSLPTKLAMGAPVAETVRAVAPDGSEPMGVAIHESLFNQGLYALWRAGYFDATLNDTTPGLVLSPGLVITFATQLPPVAVVRDHRVELSWGGVTAQMSHATLFPVPIPMTLGARASMAVRLQGNALVFDDFTMDELHLTVDATDLDPFVRSLLESAVPSMLKLVVGDALRNAVPAIALPSFTLPPTVTNYGLPAGAKFGITGPTLDIQAPRLFLLGEPGFW